MRSGEQLLQRLVSLNIRCVADSSRLLLLVVLMFQEQHLLLLLQLLLLPIASDAIPVM